jgi:hypothetical protein
VKIFIKKGLRSFATFAIFCSMEELSYRGRTINEADLSFIRGLIAAKPTACRSELSRELCRAWNWVQANGHLRDVVGRGWMLKLHRAGLIELPPPRTKGLPNSSIYKRKPALVSIDQTPLEVEFSQIKPLRFQQVRRSPAEKLFNSLIQEHHYLGYTQPVGEHLKFMVYAKERPVACVAWSSAARHLGARDRFIGWSMAARKQNIRFIAYNPRYLILPWVKVPHLASHILGWMARNLPREWEKMYGHPVHLLETFIDVGRYRGTCYRAANWVSVGVTTGRGKNDLTHKQNRPIKEILVYPVHKNFRALLQSEDPCVQNLMR